MIGMCEKGEAIPSLLDDCVVPAHEYYSYKRAFEILQMLLARSIAKRNPAWAELRKHIKQCVLFSFVKDWENIPEGFRRCSHCAEIKPLDDFYNRPTGKDGKHSECKLCRKIVKKLRAKHEYKILTDSYVRQLLKHGTILETTDFGSEVIDLHRKLLTLKHGKY